MADDFFAQLAGGALHDPRPADPPTADPPAADPPAADPEQGDPEQGEYPAARDRPCAGVDPSAEHPLGPAPGRRPPTRSTPLHPAPSGGDARSRSSADAERPGRRRFAARVAAVVAIGVAVLALFSTLLGGHDDRPLGAHARERAGSNGSPAPAGARLRLNWRAAPGEDQTLTASWSRGGDATLAGRLTTPGGQPIQGADVSVLGSDPARPQLGSRAIGDVRTDAQGRFHATVALDQGSARKRLTFVYLPHAQDPSPAARATATLAVRAPVTVGAKPTRLRQRGRVRLHGATVPAARVRLLSMTPGDPRWRAIATLRARHSGNWQRTLELPAPGTYRLLVRVGPDTSRGYGGAQTAPLTVRIR